MMITAKQQVLEQIEQQHCQPQSASLKVSPLISAILLIWVGLFAVALVLVFVSRSGSSPVNPFAAYADVLPGQPGSNAEARGFLCGEYGLEYHVVETCALRPETGIFSLVTVGKDQDVIASVGFTLRDDTFSLGEMALAFEGQSRRGKINNLWYLDRFGADVFLDPGRSGYFQPVRYVYLYQTPPLTIRNQP